jgi:hypothetical protein
MVEGGAAVFFFHLYARRHHLRKTGGADLEPGSEGAKRKSAKICPQEKEIQMQVRVGQACFGVGKEAMHLQFRSVCEQRFQ